MSKRTSAEDYQHLKKKLLKYERRLQRLYPPLEDSEYHEIESEDWLEESPEGNNLADVFEDPEVTVVPEVAIVPGDPQVAAVSNEIPPISQDKPSTSQDASSDNINVDLDQNTMIILGEDPSTSVKYGPDLHIEITRRFQHITTEGLGKDCRKELLAKYLVPSNCHHIATPTLNAELKAAIPEVVAKRDKAIEVKQHQMASAISCLGQVITSQLISKNNELLPKLMDAGRILCDIQHYDSVTRRNFILSSLKRDMKDHLASTKIDEFLFGENLADTIKSAKAVTKSGTELKPDTSAKSGPKRPNNPPPQRHLNRKAPAPARRPPGAPPRSREPAATQPPPPPTRPSRRLPPQHQSRRRF